MVRRRRDREPLPRPAGGGHDHDKGHGHANTHGHGHTHDEGQWRDGLPARPDLPPGAGRGRVLYLDAFAGLAGDMVVASLVDLGVPHHVVEEAAAALPLEGFRLKFGQRVRSGIVATAFDVEVHGAQPERTYGDVRALVEAAPLSPGVRDRALRTFQRLAVAEARVHRSALDEVHFHEVGAIDALVDVVGSAAALAYLDARVEVSPLPMGRGFVQARHGTLPLPAPAVVECLAGFELVDGGAAFEFVTPTGAALVAAHAESSTRWPRLAPVAVGWGAGTKSLADRPNLLRCVLGSREEKPIAEGFVVLEANLDDATGELVGATLQALLEAGAVDAWATPITMKKGRPAVTLSALAPAARRSVVETAMLRETTSLGVRGYEVTRLERPRRIVRVATRYGELPVKVAEGPFGPPQRKPEFDACLAAAHAHRVPVREVIHAALRALERQGEFPGDSGANEG